MRLQPNKRYILANSFNFHQSAVNLLSMSGVWQIEKPSLEHICQKRFGQVGYGHATALKRVMLCASVWWTSVVRDHAHIHSGIVAANSAAKDVSAVHLCIELIRRSNHWESLGKPRSLGRPRLGFQECQVATQRQHQIVACNHIPVNRCYIAQFNRVSSRVT